MSDQLPALPHLLPLLQPGQGGGTSVGVGSETGKIRCSRWSKFGVTGCIIQAGAAGSGSHCTAGATTADDGGVHPALSSSEIPSKLIVDFLNMAQLLIALLIDAVVLRLQLLTVLRAALQLGGNRLADLAPLLLMGQAQAGHIRVGLRGSPSPGRAEAGGEDHRSQHQGRH